MFPEPRVAVAPLQVRTAGPQIVRIAAMGGIQLDGAQAMLADAIGGKGADGRWSAYESCVYCPRQNLKTELAIARLLFGLFVAREASQVYSSHMVPSATKMFKRLCRAIDRHPALGARISRTSNRRGSESVELSTGQLVECVARSADSGRGYTGTTVILDEAHALDADMLGALLPTLATAGDPKVIYLLSLADERSLHVAMLRARALAGQPGVSWHEWSIGPDDDPADRAVWRRCNPAVAAGRISMEFLEAEYRAMGPDVFAREHLGRSEWPTGAPDEWQSIDQAAWEACACPGVSTDPGPAVAAVVEAPEGYSAPEARPEWQSWPDAVPPWLSAVPAWS